jgi:hypothetical protein
MKKFYKNNFIYVQDTAFKASIYMEFGKIGKEGIIFSHFLSLRIFGFALVNNDSKIVMKEYIKM